MTVGLFAVLLGVGSIFVNAPAEAYHLLGPGGASCRTPGTSPHMPGGSRSAGLLPSRQLIMNRIHNDNSVYFIASVEVIRYNLPFTISGDTFEFTSA